MAKKLTLSGAKRKNVNRVELCEKLYSTLGQTDGLLAEISYVSEDEIKDLENEYFSHLEKVINFEIIKIPYYNHLLFCSRKCYI